MKQLIVELIQPWYANQSDIFCYIESCNCTYEHACSGNSALRVLDILNNLHLLC